jgi:hypothetical protein
MDPNWGGHGCRSGSATTSLAQKESILKRKRAEAAQVQPRTGGRFAAPPPKRQLPPRPAPQRASREADVVQSKLDAYIAESQQRSVVIEVQHAAALQSLQDQIANKTRDMLALRMKHRNQLKSHIAHLHVNTLKENKMQGGKSKPTLLKMSNKIETMLAKKFAHLDVRGEVLYQHYRRHPKDYLLITATAVNSKGTFEELCCMHPEWLHPHQREVVKAIENS